MTAQDESHARWHEKLEQYSDRLVIFSNAQFGLEGSTDLDGIFSRQAAKRQSSKSFSLRLGVIRFPLNPEEPKWLYQLERDCLTPSSTGAKSQGFFFAAWRLGVSRFPLNLAEPPK